ncbi:MAG: PAS domain S-box protein [bacterium]|nr:PAS domain S-box protein [bacterium]
MFWEGIGILCWFPPHFTSVGVLCTIHHVGLISFAAFSLLICSLLFIFTKIRRTWIGTKVQLLQDNHRLKKKLTCIENRSAAFGSFMSQILVETDTRGRVQYINGSWRKLLEADDSQVSYFGFVNHFIHPSDLQNFQSSFQGILDGSERQDFRLRLLGATGSEFPVRGSAFPVQESTEAPVTGLRIIFDDIRREEKTSQALTHKEALEEVVTTILNSFGVGAEEGMEEALSRALQPVAEMVGADRCLMVDVGDDGHSLCPGFLWSRSGSPDVSETPLINSLNECLWLKTLVSEQVLVNIPDTAKLPKEAGWCRDTWMSFNLVSVVLLPIRIDETLVGILVFSTVGRMVNWAKSDLRLFEVLAKAYAGARQREAVQKNLEEANRKLEHIVEFLPDATFVINRNKEVVAWNRAMEELTGVTEKEMLGQGEYAYAVPFYGERIPTLINHFGDVDLSQWQKLYNFVEVNSNTLYAESFVPFLNDGQGAFLWLTASALYDENDRVIGAIQSMRDVTYRKKSEQALRNSETRYRSLVETMNDGMGVVSADGLITFVNNSLCRMLGMEKETVLGGSIDSLFPQLNGRGPFHSWDVWSMAPGEALEMDIPRTDGPVFPARISPAAMRDENGEFQGGFAIISDLTKIREAEANILKLNEGLEQRIAHSTSELRNTNSALRQSEARFRRIIESLQEGYIFYSQDTHRKFTYISPSHRTLLGFSTLEELNSSLKHDMNRKVNSKAKSKSQKSGLGFKQPPWDVHVTCHDGSIMIMEILEVPVFDASGSVASIEGIGRDVTEARSNLELIKAAQKQLVEQEKLAALGSLVAGLSHEINTPVGIGVTAASHLSQEVQKCQSAYGENALTRDEFEDFLNSAQETSKMISSNLNRAADLLQNFKLVATDNSAGLERTFNLSEYLQDVVHSMNPRLRNTGFNIQIDCANDLEMKCDPGALYQVLSNLIMNSLLHGFEGMLVGQITIRAELGKAGVVLEYSDNGNGMKREEKSRIFEPFYTTKRGRGGTGLGMHIVYNNITQNLGGKISCASKPGRGTRFTIRVPLLAEVEHG